MKQVGQDKKDLINKLKAQEHRKRSVLVLGGTGINMWHYWSFLKNFSIEELADFRAIFGISGGAACFWYYCLNQIGFFPEENIAYFDTNLRKALNNKSVVARINALAKNQFPYQVTRLSERIEHFATPEARQLRFGDFPIKNFTALAHDDTKDSLLFLNSDNCASFLMSDVMSSLSLPRNLLGKKAFAPITFPDMSISDFDFAPPAVKQKFKEHLRIEFREESIIYLNIYFEKSTGNIDYVKASKGNFPKLRQLSDLALFLFNIPNKHASQT